MFKKLLLVMSLLFTFSCEDNIVVDEETSMKLWLDGVEVDVEAEYERITTYGELIEYVQQDEPGDSTIYTKKIFIIKFSVTVYI